MGKVKVYPSNNFGGSVAIPGDKSISHRALMFASIAEGTSTIENLLEGHDCIATLQVMRALGVHIELNKNQWLVHGKGKAGLCEPMSVLDCKNSGTTIRLMAGLLSAMPFMAVLDGTDQIKARPMDRVVIPLRQMGAQIFGRSENRLAPLVTTPSKIKGIAHKLAVKSAQVKSALMLAGLFGDGETTIHHTKATRDHSERMLLHMGADIRVSENSVVVSPLVKELTPLALSIPGDISSAAFLLVAGAVLATRPLILRAVGINDTRTGILDALKMMGARCTFSNERTVANEPVADIQIEKSKLIGATFAGDLVVRMIDEIPVLALLATQAYGTTVIKDAHELKVKESNRITKTVELLKTLGAEINETDDGMIIKGPTQLHGAEVMSFGDHRLGLMMSIAGLMADSPVTIHGAHVSDDSFPGFYNCLSALGAQTEV
jgi:3-phosphoshikimate 1-carboxyvinyltransferase